MAEQRRFLDVWIVESNTVYREVPFLVVADWTQQGRLLEDDMLRPSGTEKWFRLGDTAGMAAYLPKAEPYRTEDQAEAMEPVEIDFAWKRPASSEDDDPDMIPLIDISLVLLIFFMMTSTVAAISSSINVPDVENGTILSGSDNLWIGIDRSGSGNAVYSIGRGEKGAEPDDQGLTEADVLKKVAERLRGITDPVEVRITADRDLPYETVQKMTIALEPYRQKKLLRNIRAEVSERKGS
jgi:biopolymer transport protein ExbD